MHINEIRRFFSESVGFINSFLLILFWVLIIYGFDEAGDAGLTIIAAVIHELGHFCYYVFSGKTFMKFGARANGLRITKKQNLSFQQEIVLCLCGPAANILCATVGVALCFLQRSDYIEKFCVLNAVTAISNLLPIEGYDGYRCINCALADRGATDSAYKILGCVSFAIVCILTILSLYFMFRMDGGYWMYAVFAISAYLTVARSLKSTFSEN